MLYVSVFSCLHSQTSPFGHSIADTSPDQLLFITDTLSQILFITDASLIRAPLSITDNLSITDISPFWTPLYYKHFLLQTPIYHGLYYGRLSCVKTSLLRTLLWKFLYYGHLSTASTHTSGMGMSLLRTPLSLYCKHPLIADISDMDMSLLRTLPITDTTH